MNVQDLNANTIAELKEIYASLKNPVAIVGTGKDGRRIKRDWIDAIAKSLMTVNGDDQAATEEVIEEAKEFKLKWGTSWSAAFTINAIIPTTDYKITIQNGAKNGYCVYSSEYKPWEVMNLVADQNDDTVSQTEYFKGEAFLVPYFESITKAKAFAQKFAEFIIREKQKASSTIAKSLITVNGDDQAATEGVIEEVAIAPQGQKEPYKFFLEWEKVTFGDDLENCLPEICGFPEVSLGSPRTSMDAFFKEAIFTNVDSCKQYRGISRITLINWYEDEAWIAPISTYGVDAMRSLKNICQQIINYAQEEMVTIEEAIKATSLKDQPDKDHWVRSYWVSKEEAIAPQDQEITPDEIPFYEPYTEEELRELEEEELKRCEQEYKALTKPAIFGVPISFGWTVDRLLSGIKTVTRRTWSDRRANMFIKAYKQGKLIQAFNKDQRNGGRLIGYLKISDIYQESIFDMPETDVKFEGYPELSKEEFMNKFFSNLEGDDCFVWVIRFQFVPLQSKIANIDICEHHEILEKYGFRFFGDLRRSDFLDDVNAFMEKIGQWEIFSIVGIDVKSKRQFLNFYVRNSSIFECWQKQFFHDEGSSKSFIKECLLDVQRCCLEMSYFKKESGVFSHENQIER